jgi:hypothetical protein
MVLGVGIGIDPVELLFDSDSDSVTDPEMH